MMKRSLQILLAAAVSGTALLAATSAHATKYAGEPYHLGVDARALGRGGAFTASTPQASSVFWNIASLAALSRAEVVAQHAEAFGSLLNHDFAAVAFPATEGDGWAWGAYGTYLGGGGIQLTEYDSTTNRPVVDAIASHGDWSLAFGVARVTDRWWSWGVVAKAVVRDIPGNSAWGLGLDLAWWGRWRQARFGAKLADATTTFLSYDSGRKESIVPHLNWGAELDLPRITDGLVTTLAAESETYFENRRSAAQFWSGSVSVDLHVGMEAIYRDRLAVSLGSDAGNLALGAGFSLGRWGLNAAMTDHEFLDSSYRFSLRYILQE